MATEDERTKLNIAKEVKESLIKSFKIDSAFFFNTSIFGVEDLETENTFVILAKQNPSLMDNPDFLFTWRNFRKNQVLKALRKGNLTTVQLSLLKESIANNEL